MAVTPFWSMGPGQDERFTWPQHFCQVPVCPCGSLRMRQEQSLWLASCQSQVCSNSPERNTPRENTKIALFSQTNTLSPRVEKASKSMAWLSEVSRNHIMVEVARDLWRSTNPSVQVGSPRAGCPRPSALLSLFLVGSAGAYSTLQDRSLALGIHFIM